MTWWIVLIAVGVLALGPWIAMVIFVIMHGHSADRITVLEREVIAVRDKVEGLTKDLGWKTDD